jgi:DNA-binding response OmpR family regulator
LNPRPDGVRRFTLPSQSLLITEANATAGLPQILLIEDNEGDVGLIREALEHNDVHCVVTVVDNGEAAVGFLDDADAGRHPCPALVIVDLNLPKKSGKEVLTRVRASTACKDAAVVVLTSSDNRRDRDEVAPFAPLHYLRKSSNLDEFMTLGALFKQIVQERG